MRSDNWSRTAWIHRLALASVCGLLLSTAAAVGQEAKSPDPKPAAVSAQAKPPASPPSGPEDKLVIVYSLRHADAQTVVVTLQEVAPEAAITIDSTGDRMIVIGSQATHDHVAEVVETLDVPPDHDQSQVLQVYPLRHVDPESALRVLETTLPQSSHVRMIADEKNETIVVLGSLSVHIRVKELLQRLDIPPDPIGGIQLKVFSIVNADATTIAETVFELFEGDEAKFSVDPRTNSIVATGSEETLEVIEALLLRLDDEKFGVTRESPSTTLQVRVVWLVSGLEGEEAAQPADDLKEVLAELAKLGVTGVRQGAQAVVNTTPGGDFQVSCAPRLDEGPTDMQIRGSLELKQDMPVLDIEITGTLLQNVPVRGLGERHPAQPDRVQRGEVASLATKIAAPFGESVVLGVTPAAKLTSAFVVQVTPK